MAVKQESAKLGWHPNIEKTEIMTTDEFHNCNVDNEVIKTIEGFQYLGFILSPK